MKTIKLNNSSRTVRWLRAAGLASSAAVLFSAYVFFQGTPRWPVSGGFHYLVDLNTTSFPASSVWDANAQYALSDWRDIGGTNFAPGFTRTNSDFNNHANGRNSWVWQNRPAEVWLGVTFVRYTGSTMTDCDMWFNSRVDYPWTTGLTDPCADRPYWPVDFRNVARHETGHAIGFDHEDRVLTQMNSISQHGAGVAHTGASGELPHADDKAACRALYPTSASAYNVMATCWREPAGNGARKLSISGTVAAGNPITVPFYLENQSNRTVAGLANGVRVGIYLSTNTTISTGDVKIAEYPFTGDWPAHAQSYYALGATVPSTMVAGTWYVGVIFDNTNVLNEQFEGDNAALIGSINVTNQCDYMISSMSVDNLNPVRGSTINIKARVTNAGYAPSQSTAVHLYMKPAGGSGPDAWDFFLGAPAIPPLQPGGFFDMTWSPAVPVELCAEQTWSLWGAVNYAGGPELNPNNNFREVRLNVQYPSTPGYYIGQQERYVDTSGTGPGYDFHTCSKLVGTPDPNVLYLFLWTASGTTPGIPISPFGVLPLNYDSLTDAGLQLLGTTLMDMFAVQTGATGGDIGTVLGGSWLAPLQYQNTHFAAVYADFTAGIVGIANDPIMMSVR